MACSWLFHLGPPSPNSLSSSHPHPHAPWASVCLCHWPTSGLRVTKQAADIGLFILEEKGSPLAVRRGVFSLSVRLTRCMCLSLHFPLSLSLFFIPLCQKKCFPWQGGRFLRPCAKRGCLSTDWDSPKPSLSAIWMELYCWNNAFGFHPCIHRRPAYLVVVLMLSPSIMVKRTGSGTMELGLCP